VLANKGNLFSEPWFGAQLPHQLTKHLAIFYTNDSSGEQSQDMKMCP
jgi:hypothetical protein